MNKKITTGKYRNMVKRHLSEVIIDTREAVLAPLVENFENFKIDTLQTGDISFLVDGVEVARGERKEISDLVSSIFDGRFEEQRAELIEMRKATPGLLTFFLFEGNLYRDVQWQLFKHLTPKSVKAMQLETFVEYGFFLVYTENLMETIEWIAETQECYAKHGTPIDNILHSNPLRHKKIKKAKTLKAGNIFMLMALDGVTFDSASQILKRHGSVPSLIQDYLAIDGPNKEEKRQSLLADIKRSEAADARNIGPALSAKIYESVFPQAAEEAEDKVKEKPPKTKAKTKRAKPKSSKKKRDSSPVRKRKPPAHLIILDDD